MSVIVPYWRQVNIGSGPDAVRQQAITWANVDPVLCCLIAILGHNELNEFVSYVILLIWACTLKESKGPFY